jgi:hypothetical protein
MIGFEEDDAWRHDHAGAADGTDPSGGGWTARVLRGLGAVASVGFVAAIGVWGWQIAIRDVGEVPVVRAMADPMRVAPEDPGGDAAAYQGLAVNSIPAEGAVPAPPDQITLAAGPTGLEPEDLPVVPLRIAGDPAPRTDVEADPGERPLSITEALLVAEATERGMSTAEALATSADEEAGPLPLMPITRLPPPSPEGAPVMSFPPRPRPEASRSGTAQIYRAAYSPAAAPSPGAALVQLGDYATESEALIAWQGLATESGDLLGARDPMLIPASSGGRQFWRLRTAGFADPDDARRFCAALDARGVDCVPVAVR